uniref:Uncharacterized protein n=1 Tax=Molossus molossus TaxID=27622 RepID=A0A7J8GRQ5_MOLMO|nr:hypothetical protein HJG59_011278 [Molossus molossus]
MLQEQDTLTTRKLDLQCLQCELCPLGAVTAYPAHPDRAALSDVPQDTPEGTDCIFHFRIQKMQHHASSRMSKTRAPYHEHQRLFSNMAWIGQSTLPYHQPDLGAPKGGNLHPRGCQESLVRQP